MSDFTQDNLVLFPKTLDYYQIQLTRMLETERYGEAKGLLGFLLQCGGEAERYHTEWQALLGWLEAAFPEALADNSQTFGAEHNSADEDDGDDDVEAALRQRVVDRAAEDPEYAGRLISILDGDEDPEQQLLALGQLAYLPGPEVEAALRRWLSERERHPLVQFRALQTLRRFGATDTAAVLRDGEELLLEIDATPLSFEEFPPAVLEVLERLSRMAEVSDPALSYFADEMWRECVQAAYGSNVFKWMMEADDGATDLWAAALHQYLLEKLHGQTGEESTREQYGITGELRFRYEQALRWLRNYGADRV
ncbi:HEAT repeat domain-containing protein [Cohnella sp. 56]|uniref:HEAT repeat domain-containing protein n=1 Tax=Cohnella sp. 56 TaxID=3113722 RepID=UPI0030E798E7